MKQIKRTSALITLLSLSAVACALGQTDQIPPEVESCLDKVYIIDPSSLQGPDECVQKVQAYLDNHCLEAIKQWDVIATTDSRKWVILSGGARLTSATSYMDFLEEVRTLRQTGKLGLDMFKMTTILAGTMNNKFAFLPLNYKKPRVQAYLASIRSLLPDSDKAILDSILSGESKSDCEAELANQGQPISASLILP